MSFSSDHKLHLVLAKASADPRYGLADHYNVLQRFREQRSRVTLKWFSWEGMGAHTYKAPTVQ